MRDSEQQARVGSEAPDFTLRDGNNEDWSLSQHRGKVVALFFYPGDETPVCTRQMCSIRNRWQDYAATGAEIVAISTDSVESHRAFAEHHQLPLKLLSDQNEKIAQLYDARSIIPGRVARSVFVIDADGVIRHRDVRRVGLIRPKDEDVLKAIRDAKRSSRKQ